VQARLQQPSCRLAQWLVLRLWLGLWLGLLPLRPLQLPLLWRQPW